MWPYLYCGTYGSPSPYRQYTLHTYIYSKQFSTQVIIFINCKTINILQTTHKKHYSLVLFCLYVNGSCLDCKIYRFFLWTSAILFIYQNTTEENEILFRCGFKLILKRREMNHVFLMFLFNLKKLYVFPFNSIERRFFKILNTFPISSHSNSKFCFTWEPCSPRRLRCKSVDSLFRVLGTLHTLLLYFYRCCTIS